MTFKYKNLSSGYTRNPSDNATLNSMYYRFFFESVKNQPELIDNIFIFPQRVPRSGFLEELYELETQHYKMQFDHTIKEIINNYKNSLKNLTINKSDESARKYINWSSILLRYGKFEEIINNFPKNYYGRFALEVELIKESAKIEILLSQDKIISIDQQLELADRFIGEHGTSDREKIILLNQIVVNSYRHQNQSNKKIFNLTEILLNLTKKFERNHFINTLYCSVSYRGLAMAKAT